MSDIRIHKTGASDIIASSDGKLTLSVPIQIKRRSGRKLVTLPNGDKARPSLPNTIPLSRYGTFARVALPRTRPLVARMACNL